MRPSRLKSLSSPLPHYLLPFLPLPLSLPSLHPSVHVSVRLSVCFCLLSLYPSPKLGCREPLGETPAGHTLEIMDEKGVPAAHQFQDPTVGSSLPPFLLTFRYQGSPTAVGSCVFIFLTAAGLLLNPPSPPQVCLCGFYRADPWQGCQRSPAQY